MTTPVTLKTLRVVVVVGGIVVVDEVEVTSVVADTPPIAQAETTTAAAASMAGHFALRAFIRERYPRSRSNPGALTITFVTKTGEAPGCRNAAVATSFLLGMAVAFMALGLALTGQTDCTGACETAALTLLYAGGPIGGVVGVIFQGVYVLWPLEITLWVVIGFLIARRADRKGSGVLGPSLVVVVVAIAFGLVLSSLVEIAV